MSSSKSNRIQIAIIGGGITGVILALGLQKRGVDFTLYERAPAFTELGAGIGFSPNAERALKIVDPEVYRVYKEVTPPTNGVEYFQFVDGYETNELVAKLLIGADAFQGGRRSDFLEAWSKLIPKDRVRFGKELVSTTDREDGRVLLQFKDGSTGEADVVIGCDGIHSRCRRLILGEENPACCASYTNKYCFRALIPMERARPVLGEERTSGGSRTLNRYMFIGPDAHCIIYPVAKGQIMNVLLVISDPNPWHTEDGKQTAPGERAEATQTYKEWHPFVKSLIELLPEKLQKWAIFDMFNNPAPYYYRGNMAIAGDAAHATGPHLGSGAGFGIEDGLVLASLFQAANAKLDGQDQESRVKLCRAALATYNNVRYDRTQWLVGATREACALFHRQNKAAAHDPEIFLQDISKLFHTIWDNNIEEMVQEAIGEFDVLGSASQ
ncbi:FAD/NAD(P)-binding domain-containing protein [Hypoxylon trugodes]|uniref:FAD/NAD(P)-binding domain-containing protein n=1 Tax=Hypoxylon trugodes TaxID=326681 RepID=UPI002196E394|nr:FAD/NAD(P)-binding domain-containing protein [Hypoxylon trugodes]KAI1391826.1 FAD/NAD(P)-binding domain-containing protein [Hypoxylon trugodes]